jgi:uncharacterized protein YqcC (DUF446 family)
MNLLTFLQKSTTKPTNKEPISSDNSFPKLIFNILTKSGPNQTSMWLHWIKIPRKNSFLALKTQLNNLASFNRKLNLVISQSRLSILKAVEMDSKSCNLSKNSRTLTSDLERARFYLTRTG